MNHNFLFEAQLPGTTQDHLQIFNIEMKAKMKSHQMPEQVRMPFSLSFSNSFGNPVSDRLNSFECNPTML